MSHRTKTVTAVLGIAAAMGYASLPTRSRFFPQPTPRVVLRLEPVVVETTDYYSPLSPWRQHDTDCPN
jgi:hypothetical protein